VTAATAMSPATTAAAPDAAPGHSLKGHESKAVPACSLSQIRNVIRPILDYVSLFYVSALLTVDHARAYTVCNTTGRRLGFGVLIYATFGPARDILLAY
jgi:hypothetical protein